MSTNTHHTGRRGGNLIKDLCVPFFSKFSVPIVQAATYNRTKQSRATPLRWQKGSFVCHQTDFVPNG